MSESIHEDTQLQSWLHTVACDRNRQSKYERISKTTGPKCKAQTGESAKAIISQTLLPESHDDVLLALSNFSSCSCSCSCQLEATMQAQTEGRRRGWSGAGLSGLGCVVMSCHRGKCEERDCESKSSNHQIIKSSSHQIIVITKLHGGHSEHLSIHQNSPQYMTSQAAWRKSWRKRVQTISVSVCRWMT